MKEDLLKIIEHYGIMPQLKYFQSEVFELNEAIFILEHYLEFANDQDYQTTLKQQVNHIAEEVADVLVMLGQFMQYYNIDKDKIEAIMEYKIDRQLRRIEDEENKNH